MKNSFFCAATFLMELFAKMLSFNSQKVDVCQSLNLFSQFALNYKRQKLAQGKRKDTKKDLEFLQGKLYEQTFTCSKSSIEIPEKGIKYVQS